MCVFFPCLHQGPGPVEEEPILEQVHVPTEESAIPSERMPDGARVVRGASVTSTDSILSGEAAQELMNDYQGYDAGMHQWVPLDTQQNSCNSPKVAHLGSYSVDTASWSNCAVATFSVPREYLQNYCTITPTCSSHRIPHEPLKWSHKTPWATQVES